MKLNVDILCDALSPAVSLHRVGMGSKALKLERPQFHDGSSRSFAANRLYLCRTDRLPANPILEKGAVLLCVGGRPPAGYTAREQQACCVWLEKTDLFTAFNLVQQVFDGFDQWEAELRRIQDTGGDLQQIIDCCDKIFENPLVLMDQDFQILAYSRILDTDESLAYMRPDKDNKYSAANISESLLSTEYNRAQRKAFTVREAQGGMVHFSTNLYNDQKFLGNLKISFCLRPHRESDNALGWYLARFLEGFFRKDPRLSRNRTSQITGVLKDLISGVPVEMTRRQHLYPGGAEGWYLCAKILASNRTSSKVTSSYIIQHIESTFPGASAFECEEALVAIIDLMKLQNNEQAALDALSRLLESMDLRAGVSSPFRDLMDIRPRYRQADLALGYGASLHPQRRCCYFEDYKLVYMCMNSLGEFTMDSMMSPGLRRLVAHDTGSQTDFIGTLRTYLTNNLNSSKTAQELYVHRSTFQERLQKIEALLDADLQDPQTRLYLMLMLQVLESQNFSQPKASSPPPAPREPAKQVMIHILEEY